MNETYYIMMKMDMGDNHGYWSCHIENDLECAKKYLETVSGLSDTKISFAMIMHKNELLNFIGAALQK